MANSNSSRMRMPAPSPMTKPSRSLSNGRLARVGSSHAALGDDAAAETLFRRALANESSAADAATQLGLLLVRQNRLDEAREAFQKAITVQRDHVWAINNLGVLYMQMHQVEDAVDRKSTRLNSSHLG